MRVGGIGSIGGLGRLSRRPTAAAAVPFVGVLDAVGVASSGAYSEARRLWSQYTGSLARVRRSSDNAEMDFGYTAAGDLDVAALMAFVGSGDGFVVSAYDQSGNARNAAQSVTTRQPQLVIGGVLQTINGRPAMRTEGGRRLEIQHTRQLPFTFTAIGAVRTDLIDAANHMWLGGSQGQIAKVGHLGSTDFWRLSGASGNNAITYQSGVPTVRTATLNANTLTGWGDGIQRDSRTVTPTAQSGALWIGTTSDNNHWVGGIGDVLLFDAALTTTSRQTAERDIGTYYSITVA